MLTFTNRILMVGFGAVARCTLPILLRQISVDPNKLTIMDFEPNMAALEPWIEQGVTFVKDRVAPENLGTLLGQHLSAGDLLHRPGMEHRLLRDRAMVSRPRRALHQHIGRTLGSVRKFAR